MADDELQLLPESGLSYHLTSRNVEADDLYAEVLILSFSGEYRDGSRGNPDAGFMVGVLGASLARFEPDAVVFDLSALSYRWGDALLGIFSCLSCWDSEYPVGCALAAGPGCLPALESLLTAAGHPRPDALKTSLEAAIEHAAAQAAERARKIG